MANARCALINHPASDPAFLQKCAYITSLGVVLVHVPEAKDEGFLGALFRAAQSQRMIVAFSAHLALVALALELLDLVLSRFSIARLPRDSRFEIATQLGVCVVLDPFVLEPLASRPFGALFFSLFEFFFSRSVTRVFFKRVSLAFLVESSRELLVPLKAFFVLALLAFACLSFPTRCQLWRKLNDDGVQADVAELSPQLLDDFFGDAAVFFGFQHLLDALRPDSLHALLELQRRAV